MRQVAAYEMLSLGIFMASILTVTMLVFSASGMVSGDAENGTLQTIVTRPLARYQLLLGRYLGFASIFLAYLLMVTALLVGLTWAFSGFAPPEPVQAICLIALQGLILLALAAVGTTLLPPLATGILVFMAYGLAFIAGVVNQIGILLCQPHRADDRDRGRLPGSLRSPVPRGSPRPRPGHPRRPVDVHPDRPLRLALPRQPRPCFSTASATWWSPWRSASGCSPARTYSLEEQAAGAAAPRRRTCVGWDGDDVLGRPRAARWAPGPPPPAACRPRGSWLAESASAGQRQAPETRAPHGARGRWRLGTRPSPGR